jgi:phosphoglycolate phosphatase
VTPLIRSSVPAHLASELIARGSPIFIEYYRSHIAVRSEFYPGAREAIQALRSNGYRAAVCTNKAQGLARQLINTLHSADLFDVVIGGDTCTTCKRPAEPFLKAVADAGGRSGLMVGDSLIDADTARNAGACFIAASFGYSDRLVLEQSAHAVIDSFSQLQVAIERCVHLQTRRND